MQRRRFVQCLPAFLVGAFVALTRPAQAAPAQLSVPMTWRKDTPLLRHMRNSYNKMAKGVGSKLAPQVIYMSPDLYRQFEDEMEIHLESLPPHMRFVPADGKWKFKCCRVVESAHNGKPYYVITNRINRTLLVTYPE